MVYIKVPILNERQTDPDARAFMAKKAERLPRRHLK